MYLCTHNKLRTLGQHLFLEMSHTVLRGQPTASQLYLDTILDAVRIHSMNGKRTKKRDEVNLAEIIYYCMKIKPDEVFMVCIVF